MPKILQDFFATATRKAADDITTAFLRLPEDKRNWSPDEKARTAIDQVAECALLNGYTADLIQNRTWTMGSDFTEYTRIKAELAQDWNAVKTLLDQNTAKVIAALGTVSDEDLGNPIEMPWRTQTLAEIIAYGYWNMTYHEGQINYIASILGCLE